MSGCWPLGHAAPPAAATSGGGSRAAAAAGLAAVAARRARCSAAPRGWAAPGFTARRGGACMRAVPSCPADLIDWPEGTKPKRGGLSKTALLKLKVGARATERGRVRRRLPLASRKLLAARRGARLRRAGGRQCLLR
jgi:hypothetical protein